MGFEVLGFGGGGQREVEGVRGRRSRGLVRGC